MKVCILGSNISSLTLAKALVNLKINVDVFYLKKPNFANQTRTIGISKSNVDFLNEKVINIKKIIWKINKIDIYSEKMKEKKLINFESKSDYLFSIIRNFDFLEILENSLKKNKYFKLINSEKKKNFEKDYNLVFNTDYNNPITQKYFNKKIEKKYNSLAYTTIIRHKKISNNIATQIFTKNGPLAFLPLSNYETSVVYSINNTVKKTNEIYSLIKNYNFKYDFQKINEIDCVELLGLNLRSYYHKNILAFGDLLHKIHPLAGQGFNMTIRDIKILVNIIQKKIDLGFSIDSSINKEFEKNQKHKNYIFSTGIDLIHELFKFEGKTNNKFLSKSIQLINKNSRLNNIFKNIADEGVLF